MLVTGGAGFIGSNLVRGLLSYGHEVVVIDDLSLGHSENLAHLNVKFIEASILDRAALAAAMNDVEAVAHLAALGSVPRSIADPIASHHANATGTLMVLEAARAVGAYVVAASSSSVYGSTPGLPRRESLPTRPMSPYAASKSASESYVLAYARSYDLPTLPLRFFNVYGPRQMAGHAYAAVVPVFINEALNGRHLPLEGDGSQSRDFTFVDTVTWVLIDAIHRKVTSETPINLALGTDTTLRELITELEALLGMPLAIDRRPGRIGDVYASQSDPTELRRAFPAIPEISLQEGLSKTIDWMRNSMRTSIQQTI